MPQRVLPSDLCDFQYVNPHLLIYNVIYIHSSFYLGGYVPSHGSLSFQDNPIIPVRDTRAASAFGNNRVYLLIAVSNCTWYLCLGRQISNGYFTNGQMYYFGETAFAATTEMITRSMFWNSVWIFIQTKLITVNYQTWCLSVSLYSVYIYIYIYISYGNRPVFTTMLKSH